MFWYIINTYLNFTKPISWQPLIRRCSGYQKTSWPDNLAPDRYFFGVKHGICFSLYPIRIYKFIERFPILLKSQFLLSFSFFFVLNFFKGRQPPPSTRLSLLTTLLRIKTDQDKMACFHQFSKFNRECCSGTVKTIRNIDCSNLFMSFVTIFWDVIPE